MASRNELKLRSAKAGINEAAYPNDSKLEQAILYAEANSTSTSTATTLATPVDGKKAAHGAANV